MKSDHLAMIWIVLFKSLAVISAVLTAGYLAHHEKSGWVWFLVVALLLGASRIHFD